MTRNWKYDHTIELAAREILKPERSETLIFTAIIKAIFLDEDSNSLQVLRDILGDLRLSVVEWAASDHPLDPYDYPDNASKDKAEKALVFLKHLIDFAWAQAA
jgi:hypothetical protein